MKNDNRILYQIVVVIGYILPVIPLSLLFLFFYLPRNCEPYVLNLAGQWNIQYSNNTKTIELPGVFEKYGIHSYDVILERTIVLKDGMQNEDLFFMISGTIYQTGRVDINGYPIGEIGVFRKHMKYGLTAGIDGFPVRKEVLLGKTNKVRIYLQTDDIPSFGIPDPRFYLGVNRYLRPYFEKNVFINNFFQHGVVFFSLLILLVLSILAVSEWKTSNRYKYISIGMYVFGSLIYNMFFSGTFVSFYITQDWIGSLVYVGIAILGMGNIEFVQYYFTGKINKIGKMNRAVSVAAMFLFVIFNFNNYLLNVVYYSYVFYLIVIIVYSMAVIIRSIIQNKTKYGMVIAFSLYLTLTTGVADILSNMGLISLPMTFGIMLSCLCIVVTIIVIADFIEINMRNRRMSSVLKKSNENLRKMIRQVRAKKMMEYDMSMAAKIQAALLPQSFPDNERVAIFGGSIPAKIVGGDYFDVIPIDDHRYLCAMADVMGKGMSASLVMVKVQTMLRAMSGENVSLFEIADRINGIISEEFRGERFVTIALVLYDSLKRMAEYEICGHEPIFVYRIKNNELELLKNNHFPLGIQSVFPHSEKRNIFLEKGDRLLLFTDGIPEALNENEKFYGMERFKSVIMENVKMDNHSLFSTVVKGIDKFRGNAEQSDDITMLIVDVK